jgi:hypothetical protein
MATCDHPSELVYGIAYPSLQRPGLRIDPRIAALPAKGEKQAPVCSNLQGKQVGDIFYLIEARPRNPWAALGSLAFLSVVVLALIVIDDLISAAATGSGWECHEASSTYTAVHLHPDKHRRSHSA